MPWHFSPVNVSIAVFPLAEVLRLWAGPQNLPTGTQTRSVISFRWWWRGTGGGVEPSSMGAVEVTAALVSMYMYWLSRTRSAGWRAAASAAWASSRTAPGSKAGRLGLPGEVTAMAVAAMARAAVAAAAARMARRGRRGCPRPEPDAPDPPGASPPGAG